jgi:hypothetical protein
MNTYVIRRRDGWRSGADLEEAAARSRQIGDEEMGQDIRWIRSYVVEEEDGSLGTLCIYEGTSPEKVREHADRAGLPSDEVLQVVDTVLVRPDPD